MKDFLLSLLDWIYKKKCYFCKSSKDNSRMCTKCYETLEFQPVKINRIIGGKKVYCAGVYAKNLQKLIRGLKYHRQRELAYFQAKFMYEYCKILQWSKIFRLSLCLFLKNAKENANTTIWNLRQLNFADLADTIIIRI